MNTEFYDLKKLYRDDKYFEGSPARLTEVPIENLNDMLCTISIGRTFKTPFGALHAIQDLHKTQGNKTVHYYSFVGVTHDNEYLPILGVSLP